MLAMRIFKFNKKLQLVILNEFTFLSDSATFILPTMLGLLFPSCNLVPLKLTEQRAFEIKGLPNYTSIDACDAWITWHFLLVFEEAEFKKN